MCPNLPGTAKPQLVDWTHSPTFPEQQLYTEYVITIHCYNEHVGHALIEVQDCNQGGNLVIAILK